ncbi:MAG: response regulator transcription factor [Candidatus Nitrosocosmicus sp.]
MDKSNMQYLDAQNALNDEASPFISFDDKPYNFCICFIDIIESTNSIAKISNDSLKLKKYYSLFFNTMGKTITNFNGNILKSNGDSIIFYFPKTNDLSSFNKSSFVEVIECGLTLSSARCTINQKAYEDKIPPINFRISAVYGKVESAKSLFTSLNSNFPLEILDFFGHPMNICSKINNLAPVNSMVVGEDFYKIFLNLFSKEEAKSIDYIFQEIGNYEIDQNQRKYKIFSVLSKFNRFTSQYSENKKEREKLENIYKQDKESMVEKPSKTHRVLLVEDDLDVLFTYKLALDSENFNVDAFSDPRIALRSFAEHPNSYYDIVVLDIRMPNLNGLQLFYRLKAIDMNIRILFVSALDAAEELTSILPGIKFDDVIRKPVNIDHMINKIKSEING